MGILFGKAYRKGEVFGMDWVLNGFWESDTCNGMREFHVGVCGWNHIITTSDLRSEGSDVDRVEIQRTERGNLKIYIHFSNGYYASGIYTDPTIRKEFPYTHPKETVPMYEVIKYD